MLEGIRDDCDFRNSTNYIEDEFLDSFDIINLIVEIEEKYNITIDGMEVVPENFESCESISKLIKKYMEN